MLWMVLQSVLVALGLVMAGGTLLTLSDNPHWFIRGWEFPRLQIVGGLVLAGVPYAVLFCEGWWYDWAFLGVLVGCALWQGWRIFPYTPLASRSVETSTSSAADDAAFRIIVSNVLMENQHKDHWLRVIREADADLIFAVEVNDAWARHLEALEDDYPHTVKHPRENHYGMALYSRLPLVEPEVRFIVQDDVPSIHVWVTLRSGARFRLHGLHPRPPEPVRDQGAAPRDAELVLLGREIGEGDDPPTLVVGDLNDVAWSKTSRLFRRLSGLIDPRHGRGLFNSYNANSRLLRFPLDHVFQSNDFKLIDLHRLQTVGSDHFPVCATLSYEPRAEAEQPETSTQAGDVQEARERVDEQVDQEKEGESDGHLHRGADTPRGARSG